MRIKLTSIMVDDQDKALRFYTDVLGFKNKHDIPVGEYRWITVVSPEGTDDLELALEPNANPAGRAFQEALRDRSDLDLVLLPGEAVNDAGRFIDDLPFEALAASVPMPVRLSKTFVDAVDAVDPIAA